MSINNQSVFDAEEKLLRVDLGISAVAMQWTKLDCVADNSLNIGRFAEGLKSDRSYKEQDSSKRYIDHYIVHLCFHAAFSETGVFRLQS